MPTISNPHNFSIGAQAITGVAAVTYDSGEGIQADVSDESSYDFRATTGPVSGSVVLNDPVQAATLAGTTTASQSITFDAADSSGQEKTFTFANAKTGGSRDRVGTNAASDCAVTFLAESVAIGDTA